MMRNLYTFAFVVLLSLIINFVWAQEEIVLVSYYPAPYGSYTQLETEVFKLEPSAGVPASVAGSEETGMLYYNSVSKEILCYDAASITWKPIGTPTIKPMGPQFIQTTPLPQVYSDTGNMPAWQTYTIPAGTLPPGVRASQVILEAEVRMPWIALPVTVPPDVSAHIGIRANATSDPYLLLRIDSWDQAGGSYLEASGRGIFPIDEASQSFDFIAEPPFFDGASVPLGCQIRLIGYLE